MLVVVDVASAVVGVVVVSGNQLLFVAEVIEAAVVLGDITLLICCFFASFRRPVAVLVNINKHTTVVKRMKARITIGLMA